MDGPNNPALPEREAPLARHSGAGRNPAASSSGCHERPKALFLNAQIFMRGIATGFRPAPE